MGDFLQKLKKVVRIIFLLTGLRIYTGEYKAQGPKGGHYEGRGLCIHLYKYANQLVRSVLPD